MPVIDRDVAQIAIAATAAPPAAPGGGSQGIQIGESILVRTFLTYAGTVNAATLKIWFRDRATGVWYEGASTDEPKGEGAADAAADTAPAAEAPAAPAKTSRAKAAQS